MATSENWRSATIRQGLTRWLIPVGGYRLDEVTGIQLSDATHAVVTFTYTVVPNNREKMIVTEPQGPGVAVISPLGPGTAESAFFGIRPTVAIFGRQFSRDIPLALFDDGWRLATK